MNINLDINANITGLNFSSTDSISILQATGGLLTFSNTTNASNISVSIGNHTVAANSTVSAPGLGIDVASGSTLTMSGNIAGAGAALSKTSNGELAVSGFNTFNGGLTLSAGKLDINNGGNATASALGTGTLIINGGTLDNTSAGTVTLATNNPVVINVNSLTFVGTHNLDLGSGMVTLNSSPTITVNSANLTISGIIGDGGFGFGLTVKGTGRLRLNGNNTYTGFTAISNGNLVLGGNLASDVILQTTTASSTLTAFAGANHTVGNVTLTNGTIDGLGNLAFTNFTADNGIVSANLTGTGNLTENSTLGAGVLVVNGTNSFNGTVSLINGELDANSNTSLGSGNFTIFGGTLDNTSGSNVTLTANSNISFNGSFAFGGSGFLHLGDGNLTLNTPTTINMVNPNGRLLFGGLIVNNGNSLTTAGSGSLFFTDGASGNFDNTSATSTRLTVGGNTSLTFNGTANLSANVQNSANTSVLVGTSSGNSSLASASLTLAGNSSLNTNGQVFLSATGTTATPSTSNSTMVIGNNATFTANDLWLSHGDTNTAMVTNSVVTQNGGTVILSGTDGTNTALVGTFGTGLSLVMGGLQSNEVNNASYTLNGGTLITGNIGISNLQNSGTTTFTFNGGTLEPIASSSNFLANLTVAGIGLGGAFIDTAGFNITIAQNLSKSSSTGGAADGGLTISNGGQVNLTGNETYTGNTTINASTVDLTSTGQISAGNLVVNNGGNFFTESSQIGVPVIVNNGGTFFADTGAVLSSSSFAVKQGGTLAGIGIINSPVSIAAGTSNTVLGGILQPGTPGGAGVLTVGGSLQMSNFSALDFFFNDGLVGDKLALTNAGVTNFSGNIIDVSLLRSNGNAMTTTGNYTLITSLNDISGIGNFVWVNKPNFGNYSDTFLDVGGNLVIEITSSLVANQWIHSTGGSWAGSGNWSFASAGENLTVTGPNGVGVIPEFLAGAVSSAAVVTLDGSRTVGGLVFADTNPYTIAPGNSAANSLTLDNGTRQFFPNHCGHRIRHHQFHAHSDCQWHHCGWHAHGKCRRWQHANHQRQHRPLWHG